MKLRSLLFAVMAVALLAAPSAAGASVWSPQFPEPPAGTAYSSLQGVSCTNAEACTAVGGYTLLPGPPKPMAHRWDGTEWIAQSVPAPAGSTWATASGVSCPAAEVCVLAGLYTNEAGTRLPLVALWNGATWSLQTAPVPEGTVYAGLTDVSCVSATACVAVGQYSKKNTWQQMQPYIVSWNGTKWTRQVGALPAGGGGGTLYGVSCTSSSECVAAGSFYRIEIVEKEGKEIELEIPEGSLVNAWNGSKWKAAQLGPAALEDVFCPATESCMAVSHSGEAWLLSGSEWSEVEGPTPGPEAWASAIRSVFCLSVEECIAVGEYNETDYHLYVSTWDGAEWQLETSVEPAQTSMGTLEGISCPATGQCIAVGESEYLPIAEHSE